MEKLLKANMNDVKRILHFLYKNDGFFPKSCSSASMCLTYVLGNSDLVNDYKIVYHRGIFEYIDDCLCLPMIEEVEHSWIELISKENADSIIIDLTAFQFHNDFMEDENQVKKSLIESNFNEDSLYDYLKTHSKMLVLKEDEEYEQYIPSKPRLTSEEIIEKVEDTVNNYCTSQFVGLLEKMGYIILPELPETV